MTPPKAWIANSSKGLRVVVLLALGLTFFRVLPPLKPYPGENLTDDFKSLFPSDFDGLFVVARVLQSNPSALLELRIVDFSQATIVVTVGLLGLLLGASKAPLATFVTLLVAHHLLAWAGIHLLFGSSTLREHARTRCLIYSSLIVVLPGNWAALISYPALTAFPTFLVGIIALAVTVPATSPLKPRVICTRPYYLVVLTLVVLAFCDNYLFSLYLFVLTCFGITKTLTRIRRELRLGLSLAVVCVFASLHFLAKLLSERYGSQARVTYSHFGSELASSSLLPLALLVIALSLYEARRSRNVVTVTVSLLVFSGIFAPALLATIGRDIPHPFSLVFYLSSVGVQHPSRLAGFALALPLMFFISSEIGQDEARGRSSSRKSAMLLVGAVSLLLVSNLRVVTHWDTVDDWTLADHRMLVFDDADPTTQPTILASFGIRAVPLSRDWWTNVIPAASCFAIKSHDKNVRLWMEYEGTPFEPGLVSSSVFSIPDGRQARFFDRETGSGQCDESASRDDLLMALLKMSSPVITEKDSRRTLHIPSVPRDGCPASDSCLVNQVVRVDSLSCDDWQFWVETASPGTTIEVRGAEILIPSNTNPLTWLQIRTDRASVACLEDLRLTVLGAFP